MDVKYVVYLVTEENISEIKAVYDTDALMRTETSTSIRIGTALVIKTMDDVDPFDSRFGTRAQHVWTTSTIEYLQKFDIVPSQHETKTFHIITPKK